MTVAILANATLDVIIAPVDVDLLDRHGITKMVCTTIDSDAASALETDLEQLSVPWVISPGGCGANIAVWLKLLQVEPLLIAPFARDIRGRMCRASIAQHDIQCLGYDYDGMHSICYVLITRDRERTFASVASHVPFRRLAEILDKTRHEPYLLIDGYYLEQPDAVDILSKHLQSMREIGQTIIFCPNDTSIIRNYRAFMDFFVEMSDIIVMNENEAEIMFPDCSNEQTIRQLRARGKSGAITDGPYGATVFDRHDVREIDAARPPVGGVNTNGAGDAFAAGFIAGLIRGLPLNWSGELGRYCAGEILTVSGARPDPFQVHSAWEKLEIEMRLHRR